MWGDDRYDLFVEAHELRGKTLRIDLSRQNMETFIVVESSFVVRNECQIEFLEAPHRITEAERRHIPYWRVETSDFRVAESFFRRNAEFRLKRFDPSGMGCWAIDYTNIFEIHHENGGASVLANPDFFVFDYLSKAHPVPMSDGAHAARLRRYCRGVNRFESVSL